MENNVYKDELQHWGIKGMRWGQRRYQNADGTLTDAGKKRYNKEAEKLKAEEEKIKAAEKVAANKRKTQAKSDKLDAKRQELEDRKKALKSGKNDDDTPEETTEQKRARVLKSTDPKEVYENRSLLTTSELNERVNRIDLEYRLQGKIPAEPKEKTALDSVDSTKNAIDKATGLYKSVDNAYSAVTNSAIGKTLANQLGIELPKKEKEFNLNDFVKNINKKSASEIKEVKDRLENENSIINESNKRENKKKADADYAKKQAEEKKASEAREKEAKKAQEQVDEYNRNWQKGESDDKVTSTTAGPDGPYNKKGSDINDNVTYTRESQLPAVVGNTSLSSVTSTKAYSSGESYVNKNSSNFGATRMSDVDVDVIEPDWYKRMRKNGQI